MADAENPGCRATKQTFCDAGTHYAAVDVITLPYMRCVTRHSKIGADVGYGSFSTDQRCPRDSAFQSVATKLPHYGK
jgi:hypothetical protein